MAIGQQNRLAGSKHARGRSYPVTCHARAVANRRRALTALHDPWCALRRHGMTRDLYPLHRRTGDSPAAVRAQHGGPKVKKWSRHGLTLDDFQGTVVDVNSGAEQGYLGTFTVVDVDSRVADNQLGSRGTSQHHATARC